MVNVFLYAYGNAAANPDCKNGPLVLKNSLKPSYPNFTFHPPLLVLNHQQQKSALTDVVTLCTALAKDTEKSVSAHQKFITLGGDHSAAIGTWSGVANATHADIGLIWFDAHMDANTFETTESNNIHGMPLACLLGYGDPKLTHILSHAPKLKPENVVLIGIRSYESGEQALLEKLGVKIFYMKDIQTRGLENVFKEAVSIATKNTKAFGMTIDLDGFDPKDAPGTGTQEAHGVSATEFLAHFSQITAHPKFVGMEIAEFSPGKDVDGKTKRLVEKLCEHI